MSCRDCDRVLEDQGNHLKRAEEERRRLALAMESIAESLGVDAGRLAEDPWAVAESALQKAVAAEREACAKIAEPDCSYVPTSTFALGYRAAREEVAAAIRARGKETKA